MKYIAPRSVIEVDGIQLTGYKTESGQWVMSQSSLAGVLNLTYQSAQNFLGSKWLKTSLGNNLPPQTFSVYTEDNSQPIVAIDTRVAGLFFRFQDSRNNNPIAAKLVDALMNQALDIRFEGTLSPLDTYQQVEHRALTVKEARKESVEFHQGFVNWYKIGKYHGRWAHEFLTKTLADMTAAEARLHPLHAGANPEIGLDHYQPDHTKCLENIARVKDTLSRQSFRKSEDYKQAILRAISNTELV